MSNYVELMNQLSFFNPLTDLTVTFISCTIPHGHPVIPWFNLLHILHFVGVCFAAPVLSSSRPWVLLCFYLIVQYIYVHTWVYYILTCADKRIDTLTSAFRYDLFERNGCMGKSHNSLPVLLNAYLWWTSCAWFEVLPGSSKKTAIRLHVVTSHLIPPRPLINVVAQCMPASEPKLRFFEGFSKQSDVTTLNWWKRSMQVSSQWVWQDGCFLKNPVVALVVLADPCISCFIAFRFCP